MVPGASGERRTVDVAIRPFVDADLPAVIELLAASLAWAPDDRRTEAFFRWKHIDNPFGRSPMWVAEHDGRIVGFRSFLRWEFRIDGRHERAVRAVDTATHPDLRGQGLFRKLTLGALEPLAQDGVAFVFNTPNEQSRPGYLSMGWHQVGRLPLAASVRPRSALRLRGGLVSADKWSLPCDVGTPASRALADPEAIRTVLQHVGGSGVRTAWTAEALRWRYGFPDLHYRLLALDHEGSTGLAIFRLRRRGTVREATIATLAGLRRRADRARLVRAVLTASEADVATVVGRAVPALGLVHLPRMGPILTHRPLSGGPPIPRRSWRLELGDVELF